MFDTDTATPTKVVSRVVETERLASLMLGGEVADRRQLRHRGFYVTSSHGWLVTTRTGGQAARNSSRWRHLEQWWLRLRQTVGDTTLGYHRDLRELILMKTASNTFIQGWIIKF